MKTTASIIAAALALSGIACYRAGSIANAHTAFLDRFEALNVKQCVGPPELYFPGRALFCLGAVTTGALVETALGRLGDKPRTAKRPREAVQQI